MGKDKADKDPYYHTKILIFSDFFFFYLGWSGSFPQLRQNPLVDREFPKAVSGKSFTVNFRFKEVLGNDKKLP